jgi:hypothetical protein
MTDMKHVAHVIVAASIASAAVAGGYQEQTAPAAVVAPALA